MSDKTEVMDGAVVVELGEGDSLGAWQDRCATSDAATIAVITQGPVTAYRSARKTVQRQQLELISSDHRTVLIRTNPSGMVLTRAQWEHLSHAVERLLREPEPDFPSGAPAPAEHVSAVVCLRTGRTWVRDGTRWTCGQARSSWYHLNEVDPQSLGFNAATPAAPEGDQ